MMAVKKVELLQLPMVANCWDRDDIRSFQRALESCGVQTDVWLICREGNDAYAFAQKSAKPPSRKAVAEAFHRLLVLEDNSPGSLKETSDLLLTKFKRL